jgi:hypothetical protein
MSISAGEQSTAMNEAGTESFSPLPMNFAGLISGHQESIRTVTLGFPFLENPPSSKSGSTSALPLLRREIQPMTGKLRFARVRDNQSLAIRLQGRIALIHVHETTL